MSEPIVMSAITDIYQPLEHKLKLARQCLEVLAECESGIDAIDVAAPREVHAPVDRLAAARGLPVLCQNPLASTYADAAASLKRHRETHPERAAAE